MKRLIVLAFIIVCSCAWHTTKTGTKAFERACRYPKIAQVIESRFRQYQDRDCLEYFYDLNLDGHANVQVLYLVGKYVKGGYMTRSRFPYVFIWVGKSDKPYAQQFDLNVDGSIDSISGDVHRLNQVLDKLERNK